MEQVSAPSDLASILALPLTVQETLSDHWLPCTNIFFTSKLKLILYLLHRVHCEHGLAVQTCWYVLRIVITLAFHRPAAAPQAGDPSVNHVNVVLAQGELTSHYTLYP